MLAWTLTPQLASSYAVLVRVLMRENNQWRRSSTPAPGISDITLAACGRRSHRAEPCSAETACQGRVCRAATSVLTVAEGVSGLRGINTLEFSQASTGTAAGSIDTQYPMRRWPRRERRRAPHDPCARSRSFEMASVLDARPVMAPRPPAPAAPLRYRFSTTRHSAQTLAQAGDAQGARQPQRRGVGPCARFWKGIDLSGLETPPYRAEECARGATPGVRLWIAESERMNPRATHFVIQQPRLAIEAAAVARSACRSRRSRDDTERYDQQSGWRHSPCRLRAPRSRSSASSQSIRALRCVQGGLCERVPDALLQWRTVQSASGSCARLQPLFEVARQPVARAADDRRLALAVRRKPAPSAPQAMLRPGR